VCGSCHRVRCRGVRRHHPRVRTSRLSWRLSSFSRGYPAGSRVAGTVSLCGRLPVEASGAEMIRSDVQTPPNHSGAETDPLEEQSPWYARPVGHMLNWRLDARGRPTPHRRPWRAVLLAGLTACMLHAAPAGAAAVHVAPAPRADTRSVSGSGETTAPVSSESSELQLAKIPLGGNPPAFVPPAAADAFRALVRRRPRKPFAPRAPPATSLPIYLSTLRLRI
jgi:hypothetical protein